MGKIEVKKWTDEELAELEKLVSEVPRRSFSKIALALGRTVGSVIGKVTRDGLTPTQQFRLPLPRPKPTPKTNFRFVKPPFKIPDAEPKVHVVVEGGKDILDLEVNECRWPVSVLGPPHKFCGAQTEAGAPYCDACARQAYTRKS